MRFGWELIWVCVSVVFNLILRNFFEKELEPPEGRGSVGGGKEGEGGVRIGGRGEGSDGIFSPLDYEVFDPQTQLPEAPASSCMSQPGLSSGTPRGVEAYAMRV
jgi:hypothetical protein